MSFCGSGTVAVASAALHPVYGRGQPILFFEEFYEMGCIGELAFAADLRYRFVGRYQKQAGVHQALFDHPFVRRFMEMSPELLLERCEAFVADTGQVSDVNIIENVVLDDLCKTLGCHIDTVEYFAFDTAIGSGQQQIDQFGGFESLSRDVIGEDVFPEILADGGEKILYGVPGRVNDLVFTQAVLARVFVGDLEFVLHAQGRKYVVQHLGSVEKQNLFVGFAAFGNHFGIVCSYTQVEHISLVDLGAGVTVEEIFSPP
jgi:hypothetical protein